MVRIFPAFKIICSKEEVAKDTAEWRLTFELIVGVAPKLAMLLSSWASARE
jgi:hypothetical protein